MTNVTMKAVDTLFISSWSSENIPPKGEFEVSGEVATDLEKRGLATRVGAKAEKAAPENKMEAAPDNKTEKPPLSALNVPVKPAKKGK